MILTDEMRLVEYPDKRLTQLGQQVEVYDEALSRLIHEMFNLMYKSGGVGLAAPQVGYSFMLFVMDCEGEKLAAINPKIISAEGTQVAREGCLSVGKISATVRRPEKVVMSFQELRGNTIEKEFTGLSSRCVQHEVDHCNGILFIDHLSPLVRGMVTKRFLKRKARAEP
jgi:peptide deformylase